jgi:hypothetical protein
MALQIHDWNHSSFYLHIFQISQYRKWKFTVFKSVSQMYCFIVFIENARAGKTVDGKAMCAFLCSIVLSHANFEVQKLTVSWIIKWENKFWGRNFISGIWEIP